MTRVLVTGATGFVGRTLCEVLAASGYRVRAALRSDRAPEGGAAERAIVGEVDSATDWRAALEGVDHIVHAAARGHYLSVSAPAKRCTSRPTPVAAGGSPKPRRVPACGASSTSAP